jgi:hypothetical protein
VLTSSADADARVRGRGAANAPYRVFDIHDISRLREVKTLVQGSNQ